jgi:putative ATPase
MSGDLFNESLPSSSPSKKQTNTSMPLAARMRPTTLEEFAGQSHILGPDKLLRRVIQSDRLQSAIFYGPVGSGKTSLAFIISRMTGGEFESLNAVTSNVAEIRNVIERAKKRLQLNSTKRTILFIDEIHRFNKAQQDVLMPEVENGTLILIGATTHNPSFSINGPLLSRSLVFELQPLNQADILALLKRALSDSEKGFGKMKIQVEEKALEHLAETASGDARRALTALEVAVLSSVPDSKGVIALTRRSAEESVQRRIVYYDHDEDYHYDHASAFIKSLRGSDPDAAVYWLSKMLYAGEDPRFLIRRMIILASEDIGNADPQALVLASAALHALEFVGMPEGRIILSQVATYLACAPKSNASYMAIENATEDVKQEGAQEVPKHLRDASYKGAKALGHGQGYQYAHNFEGHFVKQDYMPESKRYYLPTEEGEEKKLKERLEKLRKLSGKE